MKRLLALTLALLAVLAGCSSGSQDPSSSAPAASSAVAASSEAAEAPAEKISITYASKQWNEAGSGDFWRLKYQEFCEQNPEYEFEEIYYETGELVTQMLLAMAAGTPPDLIEWTILKVPSVILSGDIEPLNNYVSPELIARFDNGDFGSKVQQAPLCQDGQYYVAQFQQTSCALMCNKLMFEEAGLALPTTYEEFINACTALTSVPDQYGYAFCTQETNTRIYEQFTFWAYGFDENFLADGNINVNTPEIIEAMTEWKKLFDANVTPIGTQKNAYRSMFGQGTVGMIIDGPWVYASALSEENNVAEHIQVIPVPFPTGIHTGDAGTLVIPKDAKNKEGAGKFIDFALSVENQAQWCEMTTSLCGDNTATTEFVASNPWFSGYADAAANGPVNGIYPTNYPDDLEEIERIVTSHLQTIWFNNVAPADAMAACQAELDSLLGQ